MDESFQDDYDYDMNNEDNMLYKNGGTGEAKPKKVQQEFFNDYKDERIKNIKEIDSKLEESKEQEP